MIKQLLLSTMIFCGVMMTLPVLAQEKPLAHTFFKRDVTITYADSANADEKFTIVRSWSSDTSYSEVMTYMDMDSNMVVKNSDYRLEADYIFQIIDGQELVFFSPSLLANTDVPIDDYGIMTGIGAGPYVMSQKGLTKKTDERGIYYHVTNNLGQVVAHVKSDRGLGLSKFTTFYEGRRRTFMLIGMSMN